MRKGDALVVYEGKERREQYDPEIQAQIIARRVAEAAVDAAKAVAEAAAAAALKVAKENTAALTAIAVLQTEVKTLKEQQDCFEKEMNNKIDNLDPKFEKIFDKLDGLVSGRPTWATALIIGGLFSLCASLIVYLVTQ